MNPRDLPGARRIIDKDQWVTIREAASYAALHRETIAVALRLGELQGVQRVKGGRWKTKPAWIDEWISGGAVAP